MQPRDLQAQRIAQYLAAANGGRNAGGNQSPSYQSLTPFGPATYNEMYPMGELEGNRANHPFNFTGPQTYRYFYNNPQATQDSSLQNTNPFVLNEDTALNYGLPNFLKRYVDPNFTPIAPYKDEPGSGHLYQAADLIKKLSQQYQHGVKNMRYYGNKFTASARPPVGSMIGTLVQNMGVSPQQAGQMIGSEYLGLAPFNLGMAEDYSPSPSIQRMMNARPPVPPRPQMGVGAQTGFNPPPIPPRPMQPQMPMQTRGMGMGAQQPLNPAMAARLRNMGGVQMLPNRGNKGNLS